MDDFLKSEKQPGKYCGTCRSYKWCGNEWTECTNDRSGIADPYPWMQCDRYAYVGKRDKRSEKLKAMVEDMIKIYDKIDHRIIAFLHDIAGDMAKDARRLNLTCVEIAEMYAHMAAYSFPHGDLEDFLEPNFHRGDDVAEIIGFLATIALKIRFEGKKVACRGCKHYEANPDSLRPTGFCIRNGKIPGRFRTDNTAFCSHFEPVTEKEEENAG